MIHTKVIADAISYRSGPGWHVAQLAPQSEKRAIDGIKALGLDVFAPAEKVVKVHRGRKIETLRPYIPGYLFVAFDTGVVQSVLGVDGVVDVLRNNDMPVRVPTAWIEALRYAEKVGELDRTKIDPDGFKVGQTVRISEGPFAGHHALIQAFIRKLKNTERSKRAKVLVDFLGRMTEAELPVTAMEKI